MRYSPVRYVHLLVVLAVGLVPGDLHAGTPSKELLWPDGAPGAKGNEDRDRPTLTIYLPPSEQANGAAVVVCPGGGYGGVAMDHEGHAIGKWFTSFGVAALIVDYRHRGKGYGHPAPLQDAQRAIRTVRARASEWHIDPHRIGIMGFSAGGHLASTAGTHFDGGNPQATDLVERASSRPDFMILCYAVIALDEPFTHRGSQINLVGKDADPALVKSLSNEKQVTAETPPTFLWHTSEDQSVPAENSLQFYRALQRAHVPAELHIYAHGRHGVGLAASVPGTSAWPEACRAWMAGQGLL
ncbi:MAG: alpha/beta hydrolase [Pirellulales bacterium]